MKENKLCEAVRSIAWAYIWIHVHINLGAWDILPDWGGYAFILLAIPALAAEVTSVKLLRPLTITLIAWTAICWIFKIMGHSFPDTLGYAGPVATTIISVISLYFHFQLLTDLSQLAAKYQCPSEQWILHLRTIRTITGTLISLPIDWQSGEAVQWIAMAIAVVQIAASIAICRALFTLRRELWSSLQAQKDETEEALEGSPSRDRRLQC